MHDDPARPADSARPVSSGALTSAVLGVLALASFAVPLLSTVLGLVAILLARSSRAQLRADPSLRGARASLLGFGLGIAGMVAGAFQFLAPLVLTGLFFLTAPR